jgi:prevent-host-death family protein
MVKVTAAELQTHFGRYRDLAQREPIAVTHHGRDSVVLMSADEYKRLKSLDDRQALYAWELPDDAVMALENTEIPEEAAQFNHEYKRA